MAIYLGNNKVEINATSSDSFIYTLVAHDEVEVNTTSTSATNILDIELPGHIINAMYFIKIRDKAGKRNGYFYGADQWFIDLSKANKSDSLILYRPTILYSINNTGDFNGTGAAMFFPSSSGYGVYANCITATGVLRIQSKYASTVGTINGIYTIDIYMLKWPNDDSPLI